jgi:IS5 family transposase
MKTVSFASLAYENKKKKTRREKFLEEMNQVIPWEELLQIVNKYYPVAGNGRHPMPMERMLRIYFMQQWYGLSDPAMEDALYDIESMRQFADIDIGADVIPDETTILNFRHLLERHDLTKQIFDKTKRYLSEKGLLLREGTIVDATIINAPSSTKNQDRARDKEMRQTKKGNQWYFGMKAHVGTCRLHQSATKPPVALPNVAALSLSCALITPGADAGPGCQMSCGWEAAHIQPDFRQ